MTCSISSPSNSFLKSPKRHLNRLDYILFYLSDEQDIYVNPDKIIIRLGILFPTDKLTGRNFET